jgi:hypothetical protein
MATSHLKTPEEVINLYADQWLNQKGIVAIGQGIKNSAPCILIYINTVQSATSIFPNEVEGYPINVIATDEIKARKLPQ